MLITLDQHLPGHSQACLYALRPEQVDAATACRVVLTAEEEKRVEHMGSPRARQNFVAGRYAVRTLLAQKLNTTPNQLHLYQLEGGKPACRQGWYFSLSHSGDWLFLALHPTLPIGVDLQIPRALRYPERLLRKLGSPSPPPASRLNQAALRLWVRIEATLKATGSGLVGFSKLQSLDQGDYLWHGRRVQTLDVDFTPAPSYYAAFSVLRKSI